MCSVLSESDNYLVLASHNAGENDLHVCTIDKEKPENIILEKMSFFNKEEIKYLEINENDVWFIRPQESELKVYNFRLKVA